MTKHFEQCAELLRKSEWCDEAINSLILPEAAEERKQIPVYSAFVRFFPRAMVAVTQKSMEGQRQHNPDGERIEWIRSKSADDKDSLMRHIIDEDWAAVAWRAMAILEKELEGEV